MMAGPACSLNFPDTVSQLIQLSWAINDCSSVQQSSLKSSLRRQGSVLTEAVAISIARPTYVSNARLAPLDRQALKYTIPPTSSGSEDVLRLGLWENFSARDSHTELRNRTMISVPTYTTC